MGLITYENLEDGQKVTANVFNERFAQIVAQLNGKIAEVNLEDASVSKEKLQAEVYESLYPIGSMYVNFTDSTNPATLLGFGVWTQIAGRVIVGYDATQTEFNAAEKTGGHKKMQAHTHQFLYNGNPWNDGYTGDINTGGGLRWTAGYQNFGSNQIKIGSTGAGDSENLQPYIVAYVWKRTS